MFTSGSTGISEGGVRAAPWRDPPRLRRGLCAARRSTRFLQLAPLSFDASTFEIWGPLLNGGTVVIHAEDLPDLHTLGNTIASHKVTTAWFTAALFNRIVDTAPRHSAAAARGADGRRSAVTPARRPCAERAACNDRHQWLWPDRSHNLCDHIQGAARVFPAVAAGADRCAYSANASVCARRSS